MATVSHINSNCRYTHSVMEAERMAAPELTERTLTPKRRDQTMRTKWDEWARITSQAHRSIILRRNRDFTCTVETMRIQADNTARRLNMPYASRILDPDTFEVEFGNEPTPNDQRTAGV